MIIVKAKLKELAGDFSVASDFADKLDEKVTKLVNEAFDRSQANNRRTVMARYL